MEATEQHGPETLKFLAWYEDQKNNHGLIDVKFDAGLGVTPGTTTESFFAEVNRMIAAPRVVDRELF